MLPIVGVPRHFISWRNEPAIVPSRDSLGVGGSPCYGPLPILYSFLMATRPRCRTAPSLGMKNAPPFEAGPAIWTIQASPDGPVEGWGGFGVGRRANFASPPPTIRRSFLFFSPFSCSCPNATGGGTLGPPFFLAALRMYRCAHLTTRLMWLSTRGRSVCVTHGRDETPVAAFLFFFVPFTPKPLSSAEFSTEQDLDSRHPESRPTDCPGQGSVISVFQKATDL